jgi:Rrf2 family nitric oxide-sensitive transcriptional repressor
MQLNLTTDYGIRVVLYLAQKNSVVNSKEICKEMGIPHTYMHKIARGLKNVGIIKEVRGSVGGFELKENPDKVSILTIANAFEKTMNITTFLEKNEFCSRDTTPYRKVREFYTEIQNELNTKMDKKISSFLKQ